MPLNAANVPLNLISTCSAIALWVKSALLSLFTASKPLLHATSVSSIMALHQISEWFAPMIPLHSCCLAQPAQSESVPPTFWGQNGQAHCHVKNSSTSLRPAFSVARTKFSGWSMPVLAPRSTPAISLFPLGSTSWSSQWPCLLSWPFRSGWVMKSSPGAPSTLSRFVIVDDPCIDWHELWCFRRYGAISGHWRKSNCLYRRPHCHVLKNLYRRYQTCKLW